MAFCPAHKTTPRRAAGWAKHGERGTALVEFVLCTGLLILPMFFGVITVGLSLVLANQVTEVCRDAGHMYAYSVDFSQPSAQLLVTSQLAQGLNMTPTGGRGVVYLSTITYVDQTICINYGLQPSACTNMNHYVVIKRIAIGNSSGSSAVSLGNYAPNINQSIIQSSGSINPPDYLTDSSVRADNFSSLITLTVGQWAFVSEMFVNPPVTGLWNLFSGNVVSARSVF